MVYSLSFIYYSTTIFFFCPQNISDISEILRLTVFSYNFLRSDAAMMSFEPLWQTMKKKNISVYQLLEVHKFSHGTYDSIKQGRNVTLNTIEQLCKILHCRVEDIVEYREDEE